MQENFQALASQGPAASPPPDVLKKSKHSVMTDTDSSGDSINMKRSWIEVFLEQPSSDWFCNIPVSYASDGFNTFGLEVDHEHAKKAFIQLVGTYEESDDSFDSDSEDEIEKCTEMIFGMIHSRYIFTPEGIKEMYQKYKNGVFGSCLRYKCHQCKLLPVGLSDSPNISNVKLYCPSCQQIYEPDEKHSHLDGAYFTCSFPHYFLLELKLSEKRSKSQMYGDMGMITSESQSTRNFK